VYFGKLEADGYFDGGETDKSCLQYLYMDMIRSHIHRFVEVHNSHPIRLQRNRQHYLPTGQPFLLYYYPESGKDYKEKVDEKVLVLAALEEEVADYDLNEYLPASTLALYAKFLEHGGYPSHFIYSDPRHREAYLFLRDKVSVYIAQGGQIELTSHPSGAAEWISAHQTHEIEAHRSSIMDIPGDLLMEVIPTDDEEEEIQQHDDHDNQYDYSYNNHNAHYDYNYDYQNPTTNLNNSSTTRQEVPANTSFSIVGKNSSDSYTDSNR